MRARRLGPDLWILVFRTGDEVVSALNEFAARESLTGASLQAIGGFSRVTLAFFDPAAKQYRPIPIDEQVEVVSLLGSIAREGDSRLIHAHAVVAGANGRARGGHLLEGHVRPTLELFLAQVGELRRRKDEETGLSLLDV